MGDIRAQEHEFRQFIGQAVSPHLSRIRNLKTGAVVSTDEEDTTLSFDMRVGVYAEVSVRLRRNQYHKYRDCKEPESKKYHRKHLEHLRRCVSVATTALFTSILTSVIV